MGNRYYIYLFKIKKTGRVIYVGSTWRIGNRINMHRRSMREPDRAQPIHKYLHANNLELIRDVEIDIVDTVLGKENAMKLESKYYNKYKLSAINVWDADDRSGENSPMNQALRTKDGKQYFKSEREAARKLGMNRYKVIKMVKSGELVRVETKHKYKNMTTGETYTYAKQLLHQFDCGMEDIDELNSKGVIVLNGMTIRKV